MHKAPQYILRLAGIAALTVCAACEPAPEPSDAGNMATATTPPGQQAVAQISGTATYRERMALSPTAQLHVQLQDISLADVAAQIIAEKDITDIGQVPIRFALEYDPAVIKESNTYAVRATISDKGKMLFTTDTVYPVISRGNGNSVAINLVRVASAAAPTAAGLTDTNWELAEINGAVIALADGQRAPGLRFLTENNVVQGFSGCNQFSGTWKISAEGIELGPMAMTMMACIDGMETENAFMQALEGMDRHELQGNTLRIYQGDEEVLLFNAGMKP